MGKIVGVFGVKGWIKIFSYADPLEQISVYSPWLIGESVTPYIPTEVRLHNRVVVAKLETIDDCDVAESLRGHKIRVSARQLYERAGDDHYWFQLVGMRVVNQTGCELGVVKRLFGTDANDVLVVSDGTTKRLIPYILDEYIKHIDRDNQCISVIWQEDW